MRRYWTILLLLLLAGCAPQGDEMRLDSGQQTMPAGARGTRFVIYGSTFSRGETIGLFFCEHEDVPGNDYAAACGTLSFAEHNVGYNNVQARKGTGADEWTFYNSALDIYVSNFYITKNNAHTNADAFAYSPWIDKVTKPTAIPFNANNNYDIMYATENANGTNKDLDSESPGAGELSLHFEHSLSRLSLVMRTLYEAPYGNSNHRLNYVTIRKAGAKTTPLYARGKFNAITGEYYDLVEADSITVTSFNIGENYFSGTAGTDFGVLLYPVDYVADGDYEIVLCVDGFRKVFPILRDDLQFESTSSYGFRRSVKYIFQFTVNNYVHLDGIRVENDWAAETIDGII